MLDGGVGEVGDGQRDPTWRSSTEARLGQVTGEEGVGARVRTMVISTSYLDLSCSGIADFFLNFF